MREKNNHNYRIELGRVSNHTGWEGGKREKSTPSSSDQVGKKEGRGVYRT